MAEVTDFDKKYGEYARWEVRVLPLPLPDSMDPERAREVLRECAVSYRGWNFPHVPRDRRGESLDVDHLSIRTEVDRFREVTLFSYRGALAFTRVFWSDLIPKGAGFNHPEPPERPLDFIDIVASVTEHFRFATNLGEHIDAESVWLSVTLKGVLGRKLGTFHPSRVFWIDAISVRDEIPLKETFLTAELKASWKEEALKWSTKIFTVFQWPTPGDPDQLRNVQEELLIRRL